MEDYTRTSAEELTADQRAANGAALLEQEGKDWRAVIDDSLDMMWDCVLDRVYGSYLVGKAELGLTGPQSVAHGFCPAGLDRPQKLKAAWLRQAGVTA